MTEKDSKTRKRRKDLIKERNEQIRRDYFATFGSLTVGELAKKYNMTRQNIYRILEGFEN